MYALTVIILIMLLTIVIACNMTLWSQEPNVDTFEQAEDSLPGFEE